MKAISLWQPWASAIPAGLKTIETRSWSTAYRGELAIHASKRWTWQENEFWLAQTVRGGTPGAVEAFRALGINNAEDLPLGCIVATCEVYGCLPVDAHAARWPEYHRPSATDPFWGNYEENRFLWFLRKVKPLEKPVPCTGRQGFFDWTP